MSTKECPSCGAEVPSAATRCKECFHDFSATPERATSLVGPLVVLGSVAAMAIVGSIILFVIFMQPVEEHIFVDEETQSVVWTTKYRTGIQTDRLMFDHVVKLEHVGKGDTFQVVAFTTDGERKVIHEDHKPLDSEARYYAKLMDKPLEEPDPAAELLRGGH
jgi:hypothetical protein